MAIERDPVATQYESWIYPEPVMDMVEAVNKYQYFDVCSPALVRRKYWPKRVEPDRLDILIAGCGANQAAYIALTNPESRVIAIDVSEASLAHEQYLKQKHDLRNLELHHLPLEETATLGLDFDLIISSGVIHHLVDPDAGLRHLRDALKPHGVIALMLYGHYPRVGVHMLQEVFRVLDLKQDAAGVAMVRHTLTKVLPRWHHIDSYKDPDRGFDAGLVDTYLHPRERAYTVPDILEFVAENDLKFQGWVDNLDYTVSLHLPNRQDPLRKLIEALPIAEQWQLVELIGQSIARHFVMACHPDRPETDYTLDFTGEAWLDYIPNLRPPIEITRGQNFEFIEGPQSTTASVRRYGHRVELSTLEAVFFDRIDGKRSILEIIEDEELDESNVTQRVELARDFFGRMAEWDHLQYEIP